MSSLNSPHRKTHLLRKNRTSSAKEFVFVTFCTANRNSVLAQESVIQSIKTVAAKMTEVTDWQPVFITIMPDHLHLLFQNGDRLSLSKLVAKFKALVRRSCQVIEWQDNFHDHRLRSFDKIERFGFYMFMNPYKNGLISFDEKWPGHIIYEGKLFPFISKCNGELLPQSEWLSSEWTERPLSSKGPT